MFIGEFLCIIAFKLTVAYQRSKGLVCVCVCERVCACVCARVCVCVHVHV